MSIPSTIGEFFGKEEYRMFVNDNFKIAFKCVISEHHNDTLTVTDHPVEHGAVISDHAFANPRRVDVNIAYVEDFSQSLRDIYQKFVVLQRSRELFNIVTGKRAYENMIIESLEETTDARTENILNLTARCREIIIVETQIVQPPAANQTNAKSTAEPEQGGNAQTLPLADQSVITAIPL